MMALASTISGSSSIATNPSPVEPPAPALPDASASAVPEAASALSVVVVAASSDAVAACDAAAVADVSALSEVAVLDVESPPATAVEATRPSTAIVVSPDEIFITCLSVVKTVRFFIETYRKITENKKISLSILTFR